MYDSTHKKHIWTTQQGAIPIKKIQIECLRHGIDTLLNEQVKHVGRFGFTGPLFSVIPEDFPQYLTTENTVWLITKCCSLIWNVWGFSCTLWESTIALWNSRIEESQREEYGKRGETWKNTLKWMLKSFIFHSLHRLLEHKHYNDPHSHWDIDSLCTKIFYKIVPQTIAHLLLDFFTHPNHMVG